MLAKLRAALPREDNQEEAGGGLVAAGEGRGGMMRGGVLAVSRGSATVRLTAEGGPYDGKMFEVLVEEDGDARLIGRSSSKKVCVVRGGEYSGASCGTDRLINR